LIYLTSFTGSQSSTSQSSRPPAVLVGISAVLAEDNVGAGTAVVGDKTTPPVPSTIGAGFADAEVNVVTGAAEGTKSDTAPSVPCIIGTVLAEDNVGAGDTGGTKLVSVGAGAVGGELVSYTASLSNSSAFGRTLVS
jgi:hypothetical protein